MSLIEVELVRIVIVEYRNLQTITLKEKNGMRLLAMEIGLAEALAINRAVTGEELLRPMTHDLIINIIDLLKAKLIRVEINRQVEQPEHKTLFFARIVLSSNSTDNSELYLDARPSDAVACAVRIDCPIFVAESLLLKTVDSH